MCGVEFEDLCYLDNFVWVILCLSIYTLPPSLINIWTQQWCNIKRYCYASVVCWGIRAHQNTQALKPEIKTLCHENFQTPIFRRGSIHRGNGGGVYDLGMALWCLADHVRRDTISLTAARNSTRRRIFMSLFSNGDQKIVRNKWNVGVMPNVITCHQCISVTEHLDLRFRGLIPVCLVAMIMKIQCNHDNSKTCKGMMLNQQLQVILVASSSRDHQTNEGALYLL